MPDFMGGAFTSLFNNVTKRKAARAPTGDEQDRPGFLGALGGAVTDLGLGIGSPGTNTVQQQQGRKALAPQAMGGAAGALLSRSAGGGGDSGGYSGGVSDAERFDEDRINSLDNSLSAAQRYKGFSRYRAKYGNVAMLGSSR
jgi:hypothetical protein